MCTLWQTAARKLWNVAERWYELRLLFEKRCGICPYLHQTITVGTDASIDHIIPKSRGGSNDITNLQWVHRDVNTMKWDKTHDEFIQLVEQLYHCATQSGQQRG